MYTNFLSVTWRTLVQPEQWIRDLSFGTWYVSILHRSGSLTTVARELSRYELDLVGVQEVRWDKRGTLIAEDYTFSLEKGNENHKFGTGYFSTRQNSIRLEFISDRMSSIVLRGRCCDITVPNAHAPTEEKSDKANGIFYEELQLVFPPFS